MRSCLSITVALALTLLLSGGASGAVKTLSYDEVEVRMTLSRDGSIEVVETHRVTMSGDWNGLFRDFDLSGCDGITVLSVTENGVLYVRGSVSASGGYVVEGSGGALRVKWRSRDVSDPPYEDHSTAFTIRYRVAGAVEQSWQHDRLHWKPLFEGGSYPIGRASVTLVLPDRAPEAEVTFYTRVPGAEWGFNDERTELTFTAERLAVGDLFEIRVDLPKGLLAPDESPGSYYRVHYKPWVVPLGVPVGLLFLAGVWFVFGRDPVEYREELPDVDILSVPPGLAGFLVNGRFGDDDLAATIMDLGQRGILRVDRTKGRSKKAPAAYKFHLLREPGERELVPYERSILEGMFGGKLKKKSTTTKELRKRFHSRLKRVREQVWEEATERGWFDRDPRAAFMWFMITGLVLVLFGAVVSVVEGPFMAMIMVFGVLFACVTGFIMFRAFRLLGLVGSVRWVAVFLVAPFVLIGVGMVCAVLVLRYRAGGWATDVGILGIVLGVAVAFLGRVMGRKSRRGAAVAARAAQLKRELSGEGGGGRVVLDDGGSSDPTDPLGAPFGVLLPWAIGLGVVDQAIARYRRQGAGGSDYELGYFRCKHNVGEAGLSDVGGSSLSDAAKSLRTVASDIGGAMSSVPLSSGGGGGSRGSSGSDSWGGGGGWSGGGGSDGGGDGGGGGDAGGW